MSENTITVTIPFSFKGEEHSPSSAIDLDIFLKSNQGVDSFFQRVAAENEIGNFSYEYEILESSPFIFSNPTGLAIKYLKDNQFDFEGFKQSFEHFSALKLLEEIAKSILNMDNLNEDKKLKEALMQAYMAGKNS